MYFYTWLLLLKSCTTFLFLSEVRQKLIKFALCWLLKVGASFDWSTGFSMCSLWLPGFWSFDSISLRKIMRSLKARIHGATLRATSVTRLGYTVATFRATLRAIVDQRLPSSHAMMFTSRNLKWRRLAKKKRLCRALFTTTFKNPVWTPIQTLYLLILVLGHSQ